MELENADFAGATSVLDAVKAVAKSVDFDETGQNADPTKHDAAIVVIGETPYVEMRGDLEGGRTLGNALTHPEDLAAIEAVRKAGVQVVTVLLSGRPCTSTRSSTDQRRSCGWCGDVPVDWVSVFGRRFGSTR